MEENIYPVLLEDTLHVLHESLLVIVTEIFVTPLLTAIFFYVFVQMGRRIRHYRSENKRISFTDTFVADDTFKIRTIADELTIEEDFPDPILRNHIRKAWKATTADNPIMEFPWSDDEEDDVENDIMGVFQGHISRLFGKEHLMAAAGMPVDNHEYVFMITYERYGLEEVRKIRAVFVELNFLLYRLPDVNDLKFEKPHQKSRLRTLYLMRDRYNKMDEIRKKKHWAELPSAAHCLHFRNLEKLIAA